MSDTLKICHVAKRGFSVSQNFGNGRAIRGVNAVIMFAWGHQPKKFEVRVVSALPPKADIAERNSNVCFGPEAEVIGAETKPIGGKRTA